MFLLRLGCWYGLWQLSSACVYVCVCVCVCPLPFTLMLSPKPVSQPLVEQSVLAPALGARVRDVLDGAPGHVRHAVLLNAAAGLVAAEESADGAFMDRFTAALRRAEESVDSGAARDVLARWVAFAAA